MALASPRKTRLWPAVLILGAFCASLVSHVHGFLHIEQLPETNSRQHALRDHAHRQRHPFECQCRDTPHTLQHQCPPLANVFCPQVALDGADSTEKSAHAAPKVHITGPDGGQVMGFHPDTGAKEAGAPTAATVEGHQGASASATGASSMPASSPSIAGSTAVVHSLDPESYTQEHDAKRTVTAAGSGTQQHPVPSGHSYPQEVVDSSAAALSSSSSEMPSSKPKTKHTPSVKSIPTTTAPAPAQTHTERHIPSYEQWRKQVLEKNSKAADANERKQRKRKPYQESSVDVAIGGEDELGFVFPNLDNGSGNMKTGEDRYQQIPDQFGNGPDWRQGLSNGNTQEWIKSEYAKDPKDRFNHASATCAASVARASKDATSVTAILNEGKDNYMLNKCATKEKFFVVELCEEILVDTFILGNYEFFSSTFKDFVVSVNRYPPREDGWSILGYFQARNTRDAQVFKPASPQLATYIRFDFVSHYGNEYYCPVTLLRVYGATALEQLKQEEEEEKRIALEQQRRAELEKAKQAAAEAEEAEDQKTQEEQSEAQAEDDKHTEDDRADSRQSVDEPHTTPIEVIDVGDHTEETPSSSQDVAEEPLGGNKPIDDVDPLLSWEVADSQIGQKPLDLDAETTQKDVSDTHTEQEFPEHLETGLPTFNFPDPPFTESGEGGDLADSTAGLTWSSAEDLVTPSTESSPAEVLPSLASTSPASMQDDAEWSDADVGKITLSQRTKPTHSPKAPNASKASSAGIGMTNGGASATADASPPHPSPPPAHSSQDSVYKNIVNRLKVLELNSSLSYQYLEEQSNVFNEVIESSEQKINQLVAHLNDANRRLETMPHVEVDGAKRRQDFLNLSSQVHLLGSQVLFQRQLFLVTAIALFSIFAFFGITRSSSMHYAMQQSTFAAKLRAISGHGRESRSDDIASSVRIGSVEALSQFDETSLRGRRSGEARKIQAAQDIKFTPPISPMSPLTPDPNHAQNRFADDKHHEGPALCPSDGDQLVPNGHSVEQDHDGGHDRSLDDSAAGAAEPRVVPKPLELKLPNPQLDSFAVSRTPYSTPKNSHGSGNLFQQKHKHQHQHESQPGDYRPDSPVFQGPASVHDEGQLSDADVAYMSRDMNVGRPKPSSSSSGSTTSTPVMTRLTTSYYNQFHQPPPSSSSTSATTRRPTSSLRRDTTASMTSLSHPDIDYAEDEQSPSLNTTIAESTHRFREDMASDPLTQGDYGCKTPVFSNPADHQVRTSDMAYNDDDDDPGFVSDSVLDSASESRSGSRDMLHKAQQMHQQEQRQGTLGDWDRHHGVGETVPRHDEVDGAEQTTGEQRLATVLSNVSSNGHGDGTRDHSVKEKQIHPTRSRRSSSHSIHRSQDHVVSHIKNRSFDGAIETEVGLGLNLGSNPTGTSSALEHNVPYESNSSTHQQNRTFAELKPGAHEPLEDEKIIVHQRRKKTRNSIYLAEDPVSLVDKAIDRAHQTQDEPGQEGDDEKSPPGSH
ncbi:hypothetical protein BGZ70_002232 [Mortierella alpina]|uniref:SUN domain-containing protein n=1 Tax=Mortierella alpina TaxID=64518 RepID=A0A9P6LX05_MORAP|nr:hypothetical protein BGZ70_002232 [Mortierella alpina]